MTEREILLAKVEMLSAIRMELTAERDSLRTQVAELSKDAERYKVLVKSAYASGMGWSFSLNATPVSKYPSTLKGAAKKADIDAAIDAQKGKV